MKRYENVFMQTGPKKQALNTIEMIMVGTFQESLCVFNESGFQGR